MARIGPQAAVSALFALDGAALGGWMAHLPDAQSGLHPTKGALGFTLLASSAGALSAIVPFSGRLIGRFGSHRVSVFAAALLLVVVPLLLLAPSQIALAATLLVMGASNGTLDVAMNAHAVAVEERVGRPILSAVHGWFCIGGFLGGAATALANALGIAPAAHLASASAVLALLLVVLTPGLLPDEFEGGAEFAVPRGRLLALGLLCLLAFFSEGAIWDWSAIFMRDAAGASRSLAAIGFGSGAGAMAIGRLIGDRLVVRLGRSRVMAISGLLAGGGLLIAATAPIAFGSLLGFVLAGLGLANAVPLLFWAAARTPRISSGAGLAAVASLGYAAFLGGPPLIGNVAQATSLRFGFVLVGLLTLVLGWRGPQLVHSWDQGPSKEEFDDRA